MDDAFSLDGSREQVAPGQDQLDTLAMRVAAGDRVAFEAIYQATIDEIFGYLNGQLRDHDVAEDLAANIFMKAWVSARTYRGGARNYRGWLFTIARNELRDYWRRNKGHAAHLDFEPPEEIATSSEAAAARAEQLVGGALGRLNEEQRQIVVLRFFSDLSHAEIGRILGKREGAVRAQLLRALRQMRKGIVDAAP